MVVVTPCSVNRIGSFAKPSHLAAFGFIHTTGPLATAEVTDKGVSS
jgi:hypothetical protein